MLNVNATWKNKVEGEWVSVRWQKPIESNDEMNAALIIINIHMNTEISYNNNVISFKD